MNFRRVIGDRVRAETHLDRRTGPRRRKSGARPSRDWYPRPVNIQLLLRYGEVLAIAGTAFWFGTELKAEPGVALGVALLAYATTEYRFLSLRESKRAADLQTLTDLQQRLPQLLVGFLREHDFADQFSSETIHAVRYFPDDWKAPDRQFHDKTLEEQLRVLVGAIDSFRTTMVATTFHQGGVFFGVEKSWRDGPKAAQYEEAVTKLNEEATVIADERDKLVALARKRLGV